MTVTTRPRTTPAKTNTTSFLPTALRTRLEKEKQAALERAATAGNYLTTPKDGEKVEFRIMSPCRWGWECWYTAEGEGQEKKKLPIRWDAEALNEAGFDEPPAEEIPATADTRKDGSPILKTFVAMVVYNYSENRFQIWNFTQVSIREQFEKFCENPRYGDPRGYDIEWSRKGSTLNDTVHTLIALPPEETAQEILDAYEEFSCDLRAHCMSAPPEEVFGKTAG
jgi:hypothetical protein